MKKARPPERRRAWSICERREEDYFFSVFFSDDSFFSPLQQALSDLASALQHAALSAAQQLLASAFCSPPANAKEPSARNARRETERMSLFMG